MPSVSSLSLSVFCFNDFSWRKNANAAKINSQLLESMVKCFTTPSSFCSWTLPSLQKKDVLSLVHAGTVAVLGAFESIVTQEEPVQDLLAVLDRFWCKWRRGAARVQYIAPAAGTAFCPFCVSYSEEEPGILHWFFRLLRYVDVSVPIFNGASFLQALLKTITRQSASSKASPLSGVAISPRFDGPVMFHLLPAMNPFNQYNGFSVCVLPCIDNGLGLRIIEWPGLSRRLCKQLEWIYSSAHGSSFLAWSRARRACRSWIWRRWLWTHWTGELCYG